MISQLSDCWIVIRLRLKPVMILFKRLLVLSFVVLSVMRTSALWINFRAPMEIYNHLPVVVLGGAQEKVMVCLGDEWYRFPSAFFMPSPVYRLGFVKQEFSGLLPADFSEEFMGMRSMKNQFNDENKQELANYIDIEGCAFLVDYESESAESVFAGDVQIDDWILVHQMEYLDRESTQSTTRIVYIPVLNKMKSTFGKYTLYKRKYHRNRLES